MPSSMKPEELESYRELLLNQSARLRGDLERMTTAFAAATDAPADTFAPMRDNTCSSAASSTSTTPGRLL